MDRRSFLKRLSLGSVALGLGPVLPSKAAAGDRPNVLLIVCDDLNDYVNGYGGHPQARTPNLEALAASGVCFTRAYSNNPICAPSRSSFLTGVYPHTSKNPHFAKWFRNPVLRNSRTLMDYFRLNGYLTMGSGKLMHHHRPEEWTEFKHKADYGPFYHKGGQRLAHPNVPEPYSTIGPVDGSYGALEDIPAADKRGEDEGWVYGKWGKKPEPLKMRNGTDRDPTPDERNAAWAAGRIAELAKADAGKPFLLGVGFIRPHTPLVVPRKYFDMFPLKDVKLPVRKEGDNEDTGMKDVVNEQAKGPLYFQMLRESYGGTLEGLRAFTQAYLASIAAVDDCIGQVLAALDKSPFRDNTIVVMTSDHGWNMGEKDWVFKMSLWEESCRVPLIIRAPGVAKAGGKAGHPVGLVDVYPTLVDLCGLQGDTRKNEEGSRLEGYSMKPFLQDPENGTWAGPDAALSMVRGGGQYDKVMEMQHYSLRTRAFRYILYNNGFEELYDHGKDPYEWTNVAKQPEYQLVRKRFRKQLDEMTGLKVGVIPPRAPTPLEKGKTIEIDFEDFDLREDASVWPAANRAGLMRNPKRVISGKTSLQLSAAGSAWNTVNFKTIEVPPGLTVNVQFDLRAVDIKEGGYPYFILARGKVKSKLTRIPVKVGETKTVTGTVTNDQEMVLPLIIGFHKGGTYLIDNLKVSKKQ
jgi:arylsulfatase A-like enzyme